MPQTDPAAPRRGAVAALVTVACHVLFLLLLWVLKLSSDRPAPKPTEVLIAVNVGNVASAAGAIEPGGTPDVTEPAPKVAAPPKVAPPTPPTPPAPQPKAQRPTPRTREVDQPLQTQQHEQSLQVEATRRAEAERQAKAKAEAAQRAAEALAASRRAQSQQIGNSVAGAFGKQAGQAGSQGTAASGTGNQGDPNGSPSSYALSGRKIISNGGALVAPRVQRAVEGNVRVRIVVDGNGAVIRATIAPGTNIADPSVRAAALEAARKTRFNAVPGSDEQEGSITYHFKIRA
ncbi:energy transducer TonB [uncultured Porphyromonas sp.]|uniref:energy transducer TonB family protein n=1 Tax=uncultured Porphyromonas sp. TaxID=159274 RepID=UPI002597C143|nr:energy transducer TonB [uncultured Porphyromonas sp.]